MRIYIIGNDGNTLSREPLAEVNECYEATCRSTSISRAVRAATFWRSAWNGQGRARTGEGGDPRHRSRPVGGMLAVASEKERPEVLRNGCDSNAATCAASTSLAGNLEW
jgi:hypothetical protein